MVTPGVAAIPFPRGMDMPAPHRSSVSHQPSQPSLHRQLGTNPWKRSPGAMRKQRYGPKSRTHGGCRLQERTESVSDATRDAPVVRAEGSEGPGGVQQARKGTSVTLRKPCLRFRRARPAARIFGTPVGKAFCSSAGSVPALRRRRERALLSRPGGMSGPRVSALPAAWQGQGPACQRCAPPVPTAPLRSAHARPWRLHTAGRRGPGAASEVRAQERGPGAPRPSGPSPSETQSTRTPPHGPRGALTRRPVTTKRSSASSNWILCLFPQPANESAN